jgi:hypothetical protein
MTKENSCIAHVYKSFKIFSSIIFKRALELIASLKGTNILFDIIFEDYNCYLFYGLKNFNDQYLNVFYMNRREISALTSENYSLERQLFSYQKSISVANNATRVNMGQRSSSDAYLHNSSMHYLSNHQSHQHQHQLIHHQNHRPYDDHHSMVSEAQSLSESEYA